REHLDEWFDSHIAIPVTSPSLKMQQKIALQELSVHRTGRVYLLEQLAADDASPQLASEIGGILAYRAAAARALQRYDFMSLAEMQQILRTLVAHDELIKSGAEPSD